MTDDDLLNRGLGYDTDAHLKTEREYKVDDLEDRLERHGPARLPAGLPDTRALAERLYQRTRQP